jgi:aspartate racemase
MHLGLVGGIGPAATDYYYRGLIRSLAESGKDLELTIAHADTPTLLGNLERGDRAAQVAIFSELVGRLEAAGARAAAITSIAGHFCIEELKNVSPLPVIDMLGEVDVAMQDRNLKKVGLIGTRQVMESRFYGGLSSGDVVVPGEPDLERVHQSYVAMATAGQVTDTQRQILFSAGRLLCEDHSAEAVMLGGTDLFLAFDGQDCGFELVDCANIHINALARAASDER